VVAENSPLLVTDGPIVTASALLGRGAKTLRGGVGLGGNRFSLGHEPCLQGCYRKM